MLQQRLSSLLLRLGDMSRWKSEKEKGKSEDGGEVFWRSLKTCAVDLAGIHSKICGVIVCKAEDEQGRDAGEGLPQKPTGLCILLRAMTRLRGQGQTGRTPSGQHSSGGFLFKQHIR